MNKFFKSIEENYNAKGSCLCVGLDPEVAKMPERFRGSRTAIFDFLSIVVERTHDLACAFKPNMAFFESSGPEGLVQLQRLIGHIREVDPGIPIILDAKRGDIGNTAKHYAKAIFEVFAADGITVSPYMGADTVETFAAYSDKGIFALCLTSNPGYLDFENRDTGGEPLFIAVARRMAEIDRAGNIGLVVGATHPSEAEKVRAAAPDLPFLMPGIGAQGGDPSAIMRIGMTASGLPPIVNSSRGILFPEGEFPAACRTAALETRDLLNKYIR